MTCIEMKNVIRMIKLARHVARTRGVRTAYRVVFERPSVKRHVREPQIRSEGNVEFDVALGGRDVVDWINLA